MSKNGREELDEYLENLWYMKEQKNLSFAHFRKAIGNNFKDSCIESLERDGLAQRSLNGEEISFTPKGLERGQSVIRAHRLAERLLHDVMGGDFEEGACEFEHILSSHVVDSICTLLGHPKTCPHGLPIPQGQCCLKTKTTIESSVVPLSEMPLGVEVRVAYVQFKDDHLMHKIDNLHIRPGAMIKLHQSYPTFVIDCEGVFIAVDDEVAGSISVWRPKD